MEHLSEQDITARMERAKELFGQGFNCAQAVVGACCDLYGVPQDQAMRMAAGFGGGIGRMRLTCGAACGMFMLAGLENGSTTPRDHEGKLRNYELVRTLAGKYEQTFGSMTCGELLGLTPAPEGKQVKHLPCADMVTTAVKLFLTA